MKTRVVSAVLMSLVLSFLMTAWVTWINMGFVEDYFSRWMTAWIVAWPAAGLISFFFGPSVQKLSQKLTAK